MKTLLHYSEQLPTDIIHEVLTLLGPQYAYSYNAAHHCLFTVPRKEEHQVYAEFSVAFYRWIYKDDDTSVLSESVRIVFFAHNLYGQGTLHGVAMTWNEITYRDRVAVDYIIDHYDNLLRSYRNIADQLKGSQ